MKKILFIIGLIFIVGCSTEADFTVVGNGHNMQGIWGSWNDQGNFEFFDFLGNQFIRGYVRPEQNVIGYIHAGGYHFHGPNAHGYFNIGIFEDGIPQEISNNFFFAPTLTPDLTRMRIVDQQNENNVWELYFMHINDLGVLTYEIGAETTFFDSLNLEEVVDSMWGLATITGDDFD